MKEIKAVIQPFVLSRVVWALQKIDRFPGMTITKVQGFGKGRGKDAQHRIVEDLIDYVPKVKIEMIVSDEMAEEVFQTVLKNAHTGKKGDGKIWVSDLRDIVKIRTGESGEEAV
jgi:nitrogen regulatory protein PII